MAITNKLQFVHGMNVESFLDDHFRGLGWFIEKTTVREERAECRGDRIFRRGRERYYVEYKSGVQTFYTGNIFLETVSVDTAHRPGWVYTCQADFILYAALLNHKILVFRPQRLRCSIDGLKARFREVPTSHQQNDGYNTHGVLVPLQYAEITLAEKVIVL